VDDVSSIRYKLQENGGAYVLSGLLEHDILRLGASLHRDADFRVLDLVARY